MSDAFDPRIVIVGIEIEGKMVFFQDLDVRIQGQKYASPTASSAVIKISNLTRDQRNDILTRATPVSSPNRPQRTPIRVTVDVGRQSYGTFRLFEGEVYTSTVTPPPDVGIMLRSLTNSFQAGIIASFTQNATSQLRDVAQYVADQNGKKLEFTAESRLIANFSHSGAKNKLIEKLQLFGGVRAFIDNDTLVVMDNDFYRGAGTYLLNLETGMVGVPQATESGCIAQSLIMPGIKIGGRISVQSKINPAVNSDTYYISQINFDIANRDNPFFYTLVCSNYTYSNGTS